VTQLGFVLAVLVGAVSVQVQTTIKRHATTKFKGIVPIAHIVMATAFALLEGAVLSYMALALFHFSMAFAVIVGVVWACAMFFTFTGRPRWGPGI
jgi:hypothetical protein